MDYIKEFTTVAILTLITLVALTSYEVYSSQTTIKTQLNIQEIETLDPTINITTLKELQKRIPLTF